MRKLFSTTTITTAGKALGAAAGNGNFGRGPEVARSVFFNQSKPKKSARALLMEKLEQSAAAAATAEPASSNQVEIDASPVPTARQALEEIRLDFAALQTSNPFLQITDNGMEKKEMRIGFSDKPDIMFSFIEREDGESIQFECPSGEGDMRVYRYNHTLGGWSCVKDGHNMHGLLLRDLLPVLNGLPRFAFKA